MDDGACTEREITGPVDLCLPDGSLDPDAVGWTRRPLHRCNLPSGASRWGRAKRWDYWCVTADPLAVSITAAHIDYLALVSVWFRDFDSGRYVEHNLGTPLGVGLRLPESVGAADIAYELAGAVLAISESTDGTRLQFESRVKGGDKLEVDLLVGSPPGHETLGVVIPWSDRLFQYTSKHNTRPASGTITLGSDSYSLGSGHNADREAWGCLDFGRGRWPYRSAWNWGSASGRSAGHVLGLQLGGRWTAGTGMTENALCIDGRIHKISEELVWEYGLADARKAWAITTPLSNRVDLRFEPTWNRTAALNLGVLATRADVCFGHYTGTIVGDDGVRLDIGRLFGWAEDCRWKW